MQDCRFDRFTLHTVRGTLLAVGGTEVATRPKAFVLVVRLVESAGHLVDRDAIMQAVARRGGHCRQHHPMRP